MSDAPVESRTIDFIVSGQRSPVSVGETIARRSGSIRYDRSTEPELAARVKMNIIIRRKYRYAAEAPAHSNYAVRVTKQLRISIPADHNWGNIFRPRSFSHCAINIVVIKSQPSNSAGETINAHAEIADVAKRRRRSNRASARWSHAGRKFRPIRIISQEITQIQPMRSGEA